MIIMMVGFVTNNIFKLNIGNNIFNLSVGDNIFNLNIGNSIFNLSAPGRQGETVTTFLTWGWAGSGPDPARKSPKPAFLYCEVRNPLGKPNWGISFTLEIL